VTNHRRARFANRNCSDVSMIRRELFGLSILLKAALIVGLLSTSQAKASCLNPNADSRLRTFCVAETLNRNEISVGDATLLDVLLKREGYADGIGLPNEVSPFSNQIHFAPTIDYNTNINGGNPNRPLILGGLAFMGDEAKVRRSGLVLGFGVGVNGRRSYGPGRYLDYSLTARYGYAPQHSLSIFRGNANVCSRNHIVNHWYFDACGDVTHLVRDLVTETTGGFSLSTVTLFGNSSGSYHGAAIGVRRHYTQAYEQNQMLLGWSTARRRGLFTSINITFGEAVANQMAVRRSLQATIGTTMLGRALTASVSHSYSDGGALFGVGRYETARSINFSYAVTPNLSLNLGYRDVSSSISYFSEQNPVFSFQVSPIRF
jgi:hypothetical protein